MKQKLTTPVGELKYVHIKGEGTNAEMDQKKEPRMVYSLVLLIKKDSPEAKKVEAILEAAWKEYQKEEVKALGTYVNKCAQYKPWTVKDPEGTVDPETGKVRRVDTEYMALTPYTYTKWASGDKKDVKVFITTEEGVAQDVTKDYGTAPWTIGNGSKGLVYTSVVGNDKGSGKAKLTMYLEGVHLTKLEPYDGSDITVVEVEVEEGEGVDANLFTTSVAPAETTADTVPEV